MFIVLREKSTKEIITLIISIMLAFAIVLVFFSAKSFAEVYGLRENREPNEIRIVSGKSVIVESPKPVTRISEPAKDIADAIAVSPHEIYITGKKAGTTNLILWQGEKDFAIYDLVVAYDISQLKQKLHTILPEEKELRVLATHDSITLSGKVSNSSILSQAIGLAEAYAPEGKVRNMVEVGGVHQVMVEVRVAEMTRSLVNRLGVNLNYSRGDEFGVTTLGGLSTVVSPNDANIYSPGPVQYFVSPTVNALLRFTKGLATWTGFIDALKEDGLVKILAEPTLIALSGQTANFLAGGEFPVPVPQGLGTVAIEYKPFGVGLSFTPTVLSKNKISIQVTPEVSELDFSTALRFEGFVIPGLSTRRASTTVELADGQSFAIAGLLKETIRDGLSKYPILGDIPMLGALFRSRAFQKGETELVIIATPHLVKPLEPGKQVLPTDYYIEPNDEEIFVLGLMEGREKDSSSSVKGYLDGDFGHEVPIGSEEY